MPPDETFVIFPRRRATVSGVDVAEENGWQHAQTIHPAEKRLYEEIYRTDDGTVIRIIDDHFVMVVFAAITGESRRQVATILRDALNAFDEETIWQRTESSGPDVRAHAVRALAAICPDHSDARWVEAFSKATRDSSPKVRSATADALARAAWPELWPVLDDFVNNEKDADVKREAEEVRASYEALVPRG